MRPDSIHGMSLCITGSVPGFNRIRACASARECGARISNHVHKSLDYLVVGEGGKKNQKYRDAKRLGVKTMSCDEFLELVA